VLHDDDENEHCHSPQQAKPSNESASLPRRAWQRHLADGTIAGVPHPDNSLHEQSRRHSQPQENIDHTESQRYFRLRTP